MIDAAQRKLSALQQAAEDAHALAEAARKKLADIERHLALQIGRASEADIARTAEQVERAQDLQAQRYRAWQEAEGLVTRVQSSLRELPRGTVLEASPTPIVNSNGPPAHAVGQLRSEIAKLGAEYRQIKLAPAPISDAKRQVRELVARLGKNGAPKITNQLGTVSVYGWENPDQEFGPSFHSTTIATLCWLAPQMVTDRLDELLAQMPRDDAALSSESSIGMSSALVWG